MTRDAGAPVSGVPALAEVRVGAVDADRTDAGVGGRCAMELCPNWSGDGGVCPCAIFDLPRPKRVGSDQLDRWADANAAVAGSAHRAFIGGVL